MGSAGASLSSPSGEAAAAVLQAAHNMARWHATSVAALGFVNGWWSGGWATRGAIPELYLNAIMFGGGLSAQEQSARLARFFASTPASQTLSILDATGTLDLSPLGLRQERPRSSFRRPAETCRVPPDGVDLEINEVRSAEQLIEFEAVSTAGFGAPDVPTFGWHAPGILDDPQFRLWVGRDQGSPIGAAMAYATDDVVGIYGVTVVPGARRRGYGAALTWQAIQAYPRLPAMLEPSPLSLGVYQRLGFVPIGQFNVWHRSGGPPQPAAAPQ